MKKIFLFFLSLAFCVSSCTDKENWKEDEVIDSKKGAIELSLSSSGEFTKPTSKVADTKSVVDVKTFRVRILQGETILHNFANYSDVPSIIELEPGDYTMDAGSKEDQEAAFDQPIYFGSQNIKLQAGKVSTVNIECKLANIKLTINCSEAFLKELNNDFTFLVTNGKGILTYNKDIISQNKSGYFKSGPITIDLKATRVLDNSEVTFHYKIDNAVAQDHHILNFNAQQTGEVQLPNNGITVDYTVNNREENIIIPGEDEKPTDPEPPVNPDPPVTPPADEYLPVVTGDGVEAPLRLSDAQAAEASVNVNISTQNGKTIQSLIVHIDSPYLTDEFLSGLQGMSTRFDLANFTADADSQALKAMLTELGLINDANPVKGLQQYSFSIGMFMALIESLPDGSDQTHKFNVTVTDSDNKTTTATLTIIRFTGI